MNDRIKELQQMATEDILGVKIVNHTKFAELIVRECIEISQIGSITEEKIKEHFGVE